MKNLRRILTFIIVIHASFSNAADPAEVIFTDSFEQCDFTFEAPEGSIEWDLVRPAPCCYGESPYV